MQVFLFILLFILGVLFWVLVAPLIIRIDTKQQVYELRLASIGHANVLFENYKIIIALQIFFIRKIIQIDIFKTAKPKKEGELKVKKKRSKSVSWKKMWLKTKRVFQSFELKKLWINIDTNNYYYNAFFIPHFLFYQSKKLSTEY